MGAAVWEACPAPPAHGSRPGSAAHAALQPLQRWAVRHEVIGRAIRALRHRRGITQRDLARLSGVSRSVLSDLERGWLEHHTVGALLRAAGLLGASVRIDVLLPGGEVHRLLDAGHAALQASWADLLRRGGWTVEAEVTFSVYGERGSVDRKVRIARVLASERGCDPAAIVPAIVVAEGSTARRRIRVHEPLFARFHLRGRAAVAWLSRPQSSSAPRGILCLSQLPTARSGDRNGAIRQRIRRSPRDQAPSPRHRSLTTGR